MPEKHEFDLRDCKQKQKKLRNKNAKTNDS